MKSYQPLNVFDGVATCSLVCSSCSTVEDQASAQADLLSSRSSSLASSLRVNADESWQTLEEMNGCTSHLHSSVSGNDEQMFSSGHLNHVSGSFCLHGDLFDGGCRSGGT